MVDKNDIGGVGICSPISEIPRNIDILANMSSSTAQLLVYVDHFFRFFEEVTESKAVKIQEELSIPSCARKHTHTLKDKT